jgi:hypothetical protein
VLGKTNAAGSQRIKVGRLDITTIAPGVGEAHIVSHNE